LKRVRVEIKLKPGHFDPEGDVTAKSLRDLGFAVSKVGVSKAYTIDLEAKSDSEAVEAANAMCKKLLANPTKDNFSVEVLKVEEGTHREGK